MIADPRWLSALKLPARVIAGLFLACVLLLVLNRSGFVALSGFGGLAQPVVVIAMVLFGSLSLAALCATIYDHIEKGYKVTALSARRQIRKSEADERRLERETAALHRIDYLTANELSYVADCLRKNEQSFEAWLHSPHVANLMAKGLVYTPGGTFHQDHFPFVFADFAWKALLARRDELIAKNDENKRKQKEEEAAQARRSRY